MSKAGSVAPKERVNIVYRPATGDAKEEIELPLRLLVMGDFTLQKDELTLDKRKPDTIDKDDFNEKLKKQNIGLNISVPNKLAEDTDEEMAVSLKFSSLKDFTPEAIVKGVPELNKLLELRQALTALKSPLSNVPDFRKKVQDLVKDESVRKQLLKELGVKE